MPSHREPRGNSKPQTIESAGNDLKPYAPGRLEADGPILEGNDVVLTWVRRTRVAAS